MRAWTGIGIIFVLVGISLILWGTYGGLMEAGMPSAFKNPNPLELLKSPIFMRFFLPYGVSGAVFLAIGAATLYLSSRRGSSAYEIDPRPPTPPPPPPEDQDQVE